MKGSLNIRELFSEYGEVVDTALRQLFEEQPSYHMYGHMAYFMGFADENLQPVEIYGGKRFRSSMCLMLADWMKHKKAAVPAAMSLELYHNFTLIHDDIVDEDTLRRGRKTVWNLWGIPHAINDGDGQLLLAYQVLTRGDATNLERQYRVQQFLTSQYRKVVEGQYLDFKLTDAVLGDKSVNEASYFEMVGRKTADLIAAATKAPALMAGQSEEVAGDLFQYGYNLGVAYQLCDDAVSIWGEKEQTGKRPYGDILERKKTIPVLYAYTTLAAAEREELVSLYSGQEVMDDSAAARVVTLLDSVEAYTYTRKLETEYAERAKEAARNLPFTDEQKDTLVGIVDALLPDVKKTGT